eukprot:TRINITY_DN867_c1_g2_i1.p1 TRINITY_DN867_c1_g2~~TRINITY_DN867_c1_g2_i1.p1  ORF type:complete len:940 (+),score=164.01 TRINITY_DN867_c1_g2_i1:39-2858(+)
MSRLLHEGEATPLLSKDGPLPPLIGYTGDFGRARSSAEKDDATSVGIGSAMASESSPMRGRGQGNELEWSVVQTPMSVPLQGAKQVQINTDNVQVGVFHDWVEDEKWSFVDSERVLAKVHGSLFETWYRVQGWVVVVMTGLCVGTVGAATHILALWAHGLTRGVCWEAWWLPATYCNVVEPMKFKTWSWVFSIDHDTSPVAADRVQFLMYVGVSCSLTVAAAWVVKSYAKEAAGAGVPEIKAILGGAEIPRFTDFKTGLVKWTALVGAVGGSLSIGKAAPLMHIAFNVGSTIAGLFNKYNVSMGKRREILTAATAAGVCVAFGAPLGGVLYAFEETATFFSAPTLYRSFLCSVIAAATFQFWDPFMTGELTLFSIEYHVAWKMWELPMFALCGVVGGLVGHWFNCLHLRIARWRRHRPPVDPVLEVLLVTLLTTLLQIYILRKGFHRTDAEYLSMLFAHCEIDSTRARCDIGMLDVVQLGVLKFFLTALSFGMMVPAGLFMPNLTIGACLGWCMGNLYDSLVMQNPFGWDAFTECHNNDVVCLAPSVYAMVGAAAVMGGVNRMTLSLVTIMFELTGGMEYIVPITIGVMCSKFTAEYFGGKNSIYNLLMDHKGLPFLDPRFEGNQDATSNSKLGSVIDINLDDQPLLYESQTIRETLAKLTKSGTVGYPIVKGPRDKRVIGYISKRQLVIALEDLNENLSFLGTHAFNEIPIFFAPPSDHIDSLSEVSPKPPEMIGRRTPSIRRSTMFASSQGTDNDELGSALSGLGPSTPGIGRYAYDLHGYVDPSPITVTPDVEVSRVVLLFRRLGLNSLLVTDQSNKLLGVFTKIELINHLQRMQEIEEHEERRAGGMFCTCPLGSLPEPDAQRGSVTANPKDLARGAGRFHQSEMEADVAREPGVKENLSHLPPGAVVVRRKSARTLNMGLRRRRSQERDQDGSQ